MATEESALRRGLPRTSGGEPWPPEGAVPERSSTVDEGMIDTVDRPVRTAAPPDHGGSAPAAPAAGRYVRRGLPRERGGVAWPVDDAAVSPAPAQAESGPSLEPAPVAQANEGGAGDQRPDAHHDVTAGAAVAGIRQGLPRTQGGAPWPSPVGAAVQAAEPASVAVAEGASAEALAAAVVRADRPPAAAAPDPGRAAAVELPDRGAAPAPAFDEAPVARSLPPLRGPKTVTPGAYAFEHPQPVQARRFGRYTAAGWFGVLAGSAAAVVFAGGMVVVFTQWFVSLPFMVEFLARYPGSYPLPEAATPGFPAWVQWQHFFNVFLMVLIIRSGWQVRRERRPAGFWTPRWSKRGRGRISLTLWFHLALDVLWLVNGVVFVVLLFLTGHWMRIVPTSWEVFPNALSAILQYASLDWPTEHGWVNYNSMQQLMYFAIVFIAAPLAAVSGIRMSNAWPKQAERLNRLYPVELARAVHFPVMLAFVVFIIVHVALVFATGALRNLNHMFGGTDAENWAGFWIFCASTLLIVIAWLLARPIIIAPIARLLGDVKLR